MTAPHQSTSTNGSESSNAMRFDPTNPLNYSEIMGNQAMQLENQDRLDSFFGERMVDVRNALRGMGWTGGSSVLEKPQARIKHRCTYVGAGSNVVAVEYDIESDAMGFFTVVDNLFQTAEQLASWLDMHTEAPIERPE